MPNFKTATNEDVLKSGFLYARNPDTQEIKKIASPVDFQVGLTNASKDLTVTGDLEVNGGDITTTAATFNLVNAATTINLGSTAVARTTNIATGAAAQTITLGSTTDASSTTIDAGTGVIDIGTSVSARTITIGPKNSLTAAAISHQIDVGYIPSNGAATTTVNIGTAGFGSTRNIIKIGNYGSTVASSTTIYGDTISIGVNPGSVTFPGDIAVDGGDITTTSTGIATIFNTKATTLNIGGAATSLNAGASTVLATIGQTELGAWPTNTTYAYFAHKDVTAATAVTGYALLQNSAGHTYLNAGSGGSVNILNAGSPIATLNNNTISLTGKSGTSTTTTLGNTHGTSSTTINAGTGGITIGAVGAKIGFFGVTTAVKQTTSNMTNSITAGGTSNTLTNYTNLSTYSSDAAAIRGNFYRIGLKLNEIIDALQAYGLM